MHLGSYILNYQDSSGKVPSFVGLFCKRDRAISRAYRNNARDLLTQIYFVYRFQHPNSTTHIPALSLDITRTRLRLHLQ